MPTNITQIEDPDRNRTIFRIEGEMFLEDALLLEKIAMQLREEGVKNITLDLADLDFLDSESAPILKRLERDLGIEIEGVELFLQTIVNEAEHKKF